MKFPVFSNNLQQLHVSNSCMFSKNFQQFQFFQQLYVFKNFQFPTLHVFQQFPTIPLFPTISNNSSFSNNCMFSNDSTFPKNCMFSNHFQRFHLFHQVPTNPVFPTIACFPTIILFPANYKHYAVIGRSISNSAKKCFTKIWAFQQFTCIPTLCNHFQTPCFLPIFKLFQQFIFSNDAEISFCFLVKFSIFDQMFEF